MKFRHFTEKPQRARPVWREEQPEVGTLSWMWRRMLQKISGLASGLSTSFWSEHCFFVHLPPCSSLEGILSDALRFILS